MPGRIIQEIRKAGSRNPVFMLDELDKVGARFPRRSDVGVAGDTRPGPEQHVPGPLPQRAVRPVEGAVYRDGPTTWRPVPPALRDRMELIELPGYTAREKLKIATQYLVPRQLKENGLKPNQAKWSEAAAEPDYRPLHA